VNGAGDEFRVMAAWFSGKGFRVQQTWIGWKVLAGLTAASMFATQRLD
jgi:hypothetical protein